MDQIQHELAEFLHLIKRLRKECPWDRAQTIDSLKDNLLEESEEIAEAIRRKDIRGMEEELGDLLLVITMIAEIGSEKDYFNIQSIIKRINRKLVFRHPHIFSDQVAQSPEEVKKIWQKMKKLETPSGHLLNRVAQQQKQASQLGFDWPDVEGVYDKLQEEISELRQTEEYDRQVDELGDILFVVVHLANHLNIDPEIALQHTLEKFNTRFNYVQQKMSKNNISMEKGNLEIMEKYWREKAEQE
ncbi:MAG: nucleoside triphosphate pyrophosphohydrolase [bacterium]